MIGLILTVVIGLGIAFFSSKSTSPVTLIIGGFRYSDIPLYAITVGTYLLGLILAWVIGVPQTIATTFRIMGLGRTVKTGNNTIAQLQNKISKLETENIKLRESNNQSIIVNKQADGSYKPNIIQNFLHRLNLR